ncbi:MAG: YbaK/EbsC family protein [Deltaproteobacteria bacterium]|nr:YbaK/EbsC family protein [Deltaproteobacteria bacterium]
MSGIVPRLEKFLEEHGVEYDVIPHKNDYRAKVTARDTGTPQSEFAKTVFVLIDGEDALVVVPADRDVALSKLRDALGATEVCLAREDEFHEFCPDCEVGAAPPFGNLYGLPVYVSTSLAADDMITFNAGTHSSAVRMAYSDFERLVGPRVLALCKHE